MSAPSAPLAPVDLELLRAAAAGLEPVDEPYAAWGGALGLAGDAVVQRLRSLVNRGQIDGVRLLPPPAPETSMPALERELIAALVDGMPLVPRPFDLLGAMLDVPGDDIRRLLRGWLADGRIRRIVPTGPATEVAANVR